MREKLFGMQGRGSEQAGALWALTLLPCHATMKGDFKPERGIGFLGGLRSFDLLWGDVELQQDAEGVCRVGCGIVLCC